MYIIPWKNTYINSDKKWVGVQFGWFFSQTRDCWVNLFVEHEQVDQMLS
jgi:hypothetical protein